MQAISRIERLTLVLLVVPVALFLVESVLPGPLRHEIDLFHEGEGLAAAWLTAEGFFPWRDLVGLHGLLEDVFIWIIGLRIFDDSRWGAFAGQTLLVFPAYWVGLYFLYAYLFRRNWLFLAAATLSIPTGLITHRQDRFILQPFVALLLGALLAKPEIWRAAAFITLLGIQAVVTPESAYTVVAFSLAVVGYEGYHHTRAGTVRDTFPRTIWCALFGGAFVVVWFAYLAANGAAGDFLSYYLTFGRGHVLTGGLPIQWTDGSFRFAVYMPIVLILVAFWYLTFRITRRRPIGTEDWVMAAWVLFLFLYYTKFLSRADNHVYQVYAVAFPAFLYAVYKFVSAVDAQVSQARWLGRLRHVTRHPATLVVLGTVLVTRWGPLVSSIDSVPLHFRAEAPEAASADGLGYSGPNVLDQQLVEDLRRVIVAYMRPGDRVFDFTNQPGMFHYILRVKPATKYYHVSLAIRTATQREIVERLRNEKPKIVILYHDRLGLSTWDGITNMVRHYEVSQYILDHYRPLIGLHGYVILVSEEADVPPPSEIEFRSGTQILTGPELYFRTEQCDWGYVPNFLRADGTEVDDVVPLTVREVEHARVVRGWAVDVDAGAPAPEVVAVVDAEVVERLTPGSDRLDVANALGNPNLRRSGFNMLIVPPLLAPETPVRFYGISRDRTASELGYGPDAGLVGGPSPGMLALDDGEVIPVKNGIVRGSVDSSSEASVTEVQMPLAVRGSWLEVEATQRFAPDTFTLSDQSADPGHSIVFKTNDRSPTMVRIQVGSCSQWHGYKATRLFLRSTHAQEIAAVRLTS